MAHEPTERVTFDAANLTDAEADGLACVVCNASYLTTDVPHVPVGISATGSQVFACASCASPAAAGKSPTWPSGEPETVRAAADEKGTRLVSTLGDAQDDNEQRPSWLPDDCPAWCDSKPLHVEHDHYEDRTHIGYSRSVILTAVDDREVDGADECDIAGMFLRQHYREISPRIELGRDEAPVDIQFTLDEAEEFAAKLLELVAVARAG